MKRIILSAAAIALSISFTVFPTPSFARPLNNFNLGSSAANGSVLSDLECASQPIVIFYQGGSVAICGDTAEAIYCGAVNCDYYQEGYVSWYGCSCN